MTTDCTTLSLLLVSPPSAERTQMVALGRTLKLCTIRVADDAIAGFGVLARERPTLTLADAHMSPADGLTFVREVRATAIDNRDAPIWLTTRGDAEGLSVAALAAGAEGVVKEPISELLSRARDMELAAAGTTEAARRGPPEARSAGAAAARACAEIGRLLTEAEAGVCAWSRSGFDPNLVLVQTALDSAAQFAVRAGDARLVRALTHALAVVEEGRRSWDGDDRRIRAAINDVRLRLSSAQAH